MHIKKIAKRLGAQVVAAICIGMAAAASAATPVEVRLWPDGAPTPTGLENTKEEQRGDVITNVSDPVLYVYPAKKPNGTAIMMCPGGAYYGLAMGYEGRDMAAWFNSMGITYAVLKYRMPNGHADVPLSDAQQAMRILRERAKEWGINPHSIGIMGASAGGHFATTLATHYSSADTRPDFQVLFYPVVSMDAAITHAGSRRYLMGNEPTAATVERYSNELHVDSNTPKAFIMVSADDKVVPVENSLRYYKALTDNGVSAALHIYPTGGHGWGYHDSFVYKPAWTAELERWLRQEILP